MVGKIRGNGIKKSKGVMVMREDVLHLISEDGLEGRKACVP